MRLHMQIQDRKANRKNSKKCVRLQIKPTRKIQKLRKKDDRREFFVRIGMLDKIKEYKLLPLSTYTNIDKNSLRDTTKSTTK